MNTTTECHAIEARWPGWHIFLSDAGKPWATSVHHVDETGCGVTLDAPGMARIEQVIAEWEHEHRMAAARLDMERQVAEAMAGSLLPTLGGMLA